MKVIVAAAAVLAVGYFAFFRSGGDVASVDARRLVQEGARLVDVRSPEEFAAGHLPGAINLPVQELDRRLQELLPKDQPVVLYCRSGNRSGRAAGMLKKAGYERVHDLGAMSSW